MGEENKYYKIVTKKGAHKSEKRNPDGSTVGLQFDDKNNLQGPIGLIEIDEKEIEEKYTQYIEVPRESETSLSPEMQELTDKLVELLSILLINYMDETVVPWAKKTLWPKIKSGFHNISSRIIKNKTKKKSYEVSFIDNVDKSYSQYKHDISSEEAQKKLVETYILMYKLCENLRDLSQSRIKYNENGNDYYIDGQELVNKLKSPEMLNSINMILSNNKKLLIEESPSLSKLVDRELIIDGSFSPLEENEVANDLHFK